MELTLGKEVDIAETDEKDAQQEGTFKKEEEILEKIFHFCDPLL